MIWSCVFANANGLAVIRVSTIFSGYKKKAIGLISENGQQLKPV
jgi:hypothetical protein